MRCCCSILVVLGLFVAALSAQEGAPDMRAAYELKTHRNLSYVGGKDADRKRHRLDLIIPTGVQKPPLVLFIHGGAWQLGSKNWYTNVGRTIARAGYSVALNNYRLSPAVQHPAHVDDCARALSWLIKNAKTYGYDPSRVFLSGHSAGGHLASLLALSPKVLKKQGLKGGMIKGVFPISGVYDVSPRHFMGAFGRNPKVRVAASPITWVRRGLPPFLVLWADKDMPDLGDQARDFVAALRKAKCSVAGMEIADRNHMSITARFSRDGDPTAKAALAFLDRLTRSPPKRPIRR